MYVTSNYGSKYSEIYIKSYNYMSKLLQPVLTDSPPLHGAMAVNSNWTCSK